MKHIFMRSAYLCFVYRRINTHQMHFLRVGVIIVLVQVKIMFTIGKKTNYIWEKFKEKQKRDFGRKSLTLQADCINFFISKILFKLIFLADLHIFIYAMLCFVIYIQKTQSTGGSSLPLSNCNYLSLSRRGG